MFDLSDQKTSKNGGTNDGEMVQNSIYVGIRGLKLLSDRNCCKAFQRTYWVYNE